MATLKECQRNAVVKMLHYNNPSYNAKSAKSTSSRNTNEGPVWKVLIYDTAGRDIISPLVKVGALRRHGVTLHLHIEAAREAVADAPAVYFVQPTPGNLQRILSDAKASLYDSFHINFISHISPAALEDLARSAVSAGVAAKFTKLFDQHVSFVSMANHLFSLNIRDSYVAIHDPTRADNDIQATMDSIVDGLFSVLVTKGAVPIIRAPRGHAASMIAEALDGKLREHLMSRANLFSESAASGNASAAATTARPLLVLFDRNADLAVMLHHTWTYQALAHDVLGLTANRVTVTVAADEPEGKDEVKTYDLDDEFWEEHAGSPFPDASEEAHKKVTSVAEEIERITALCGGLTEDEIEAQAGSGLAGKTKMLSSVIEGLPGLREKKKGYSKHTNVLLAIMEHIKKRRLDALREVELKIIARLPVSKSELMTFLTAGGLAGDGGGDGEPSAEDKLRLVIMAYMSNPDMTEEDLSAYEGALTAAGAPCAALEFLKRQRASTLKRPASMAGGSTAGSGQRGAAQQKLAEMFNWGSSMVKKTAMESMHALRGSQTQFSIVTMMDSLMGVKDNKVTDDFLYFDPRAAAGSAPRSRTPFKEAIAFVVGGGNFIEYQALQDYALGRTEVNSNNGGSGLNSPSVAAGGSGGFGGAKTITYGSTEMLSAGELLSQMVDIHKRTAPPPTTPALD